MENNKNIISGIELKSVFRVKDDNAILSYVEKGILPKSLSQVENDLLFDRKEVLKMLGLPEINEPIMGTKEAEKLLGLREDKINYLAKQGNIPHYTFKIFGRTKLLFVKSELELCSKVELIWSSGFPNRIAKAKACDEILELILGSKISNDLNEREIDIIKAVMIENKVLSQLGDSIGLSRERIRQIFGQAINKIKGSIISFTEDSNMIAMFKEELKMVKQQNIVLEKKIKVLEKQRPEKDKDILTVRLVQLNLSVRAIKCLQGIGIFYFEEILQYKKKELLNIRNMGKKTIVEIEQFVELMGYTLSEE